jgi:hypothetical protein
MTEKDLQPLFSRRARPNASVLSVYLNADQLRQGNLNGGFQNQLKGVLSSIEATIVDPLEIENFHYAAHQVEKFVSAYGNGCLRWRAIAVFCDATDGFFHHQLSDIPIENQARWDRELFLQPLAAALAESERCGVVLVDPSHYRLFMMLSGEMSEFAGDEFNLRNIVRDLDWLVQAQRVQPLALAGAPDITSNLRDMLPQRLACQVIGTVEVALNVPVKDLVHTITALSRQHERENDNQIVAEVLTAAARKENAVTGLRNTLNAVNQGRVWQLIYSDGFHSPGFECVKCAALFATERSACVYCGGKIELVRDVVGRALEQGVRRHAKIEVVKEEASSSLKLWGGIGAFLKEKTAAWETDLPAKVQSPETTP